MFSPPSSVLALLVGAGLTASTLLAFDANNADKVDGRHAVGAGASINARKGRLVATSAQTGRLPNNIIATAPNAARLVGDPGRAYRTISLPPQAGFVDAGTSQTSFGPVLAAAGTTGVWWSFVVPPTYDNTNAPLQAELVIQEQSPGACAIVFSSDGLYGPDADGDALNGGWRTEGDAPVPIPAGDGSIHQTTLTWPGFNPPTERGQFMQLHLQRSGGDAADTCGPVTVMGAQIRS